MFTDFPKADPVERGCGEREQGGVYAETGLSPYGTPLEYFLIDPGMGVRNLGRCLAEAEPEAFVGVAKAHAARRVLGDREFALAWAAGRATPSADAIDLALAGEVRPSTPSGTVPPLSPREREVLEWTACGKTSEEIACILAL